MTEVWCVLRSGGEFAPEHVARLAAQVERHGGGRLRCLTDKPFEVSQAGAAPKPLAFGWPGWWAKLELYLNLGPALYLDLDVTVVGDLSPLMLLAEKQEFIMCRGFWGNADPNKANSTVVGWRGDQTGITMRFLQDVAGHMTRGEERSFWGDQGFANRYHAGRLTLWQEELPGAVRSFKREVKPDELMPTAIVASHGNPRPWASGGADEWLRMRGVVV